ncbi:MAG TPA: PhzF family phenazine biosynthesis protein [Polyangiaceae bacterium]|nr:PhzF family phenazine biosynthesis protein [Polyangiaceae bacterium]
MAGARFHIVNVFVEAGPLSGNALAVFEDGRGLSGERMQAIAVQFNLSETTFVLPSTVATARVRIFTPALELPFAGHPTLGTAHVVAGLRDPSAGVTLEMGAGIIPVEREGDVWTLKSNPPRWRQAAASQELAAMLGIAAEAVRGPALWVDTGTEQLIVPLASVEAVDACRPDPVLLARHGSNERRDGHVYVWAPRSDGTLAARFFFLKRGALVEDPGTGSACANLGGWHLATGGALPVDWAIRQGEATGRPCRLRLRVDAARNIRVSGRVVQVGSGELTVPFEV